jgi:hypothetical protein
MRVLINYATYAEKVTIHCLADGACTVIVPFKPVSSLETLYRLINYVGGDPEQCRRKIKTWGHGGCWADVKPEFTLPANTHFVRGLEPQRFVESSTGITRMQNDGINTVLTTPVKNSFH